MATTTTTAPPPAPVRVPTPVSAKPKTTKHRMTASAAEPLVRDPSRAKSTSKRRTAGGVESAGETSGTDRNARSKSTKKKKSARPARGASAEERADLAAMLRDSDASAPHVHFPAAGGMYVATAPPPPKPSGTLFLPSTGGGGSTRSDVGPVRANHFDVVPPSPVTSVHHGRSASGSTSFFGRVAGLFGRKKHSGDTFGSSGSSAWRTRTDAHISRAQTRDDSSSDEHTPGNLVTVTNVTTPAGRLAAVDNVPSSPKRGLGRRLTKADRGQTLRVGPPPESPSRTRKSSSMDREERFEPASPGKKTKSKKAQSQSVDGGGLSRKGSLKSTTSEPVRAASRASGSDARGRDRGAASLMALVEDPAPPALVLPSTLGARRDDSPVRSRSPQSLLSVPPARAVSPTRTAAPKPVRATSPMPLKSAMRNTTPSPMPHVTSPTHVVSPTSPIHAASPTVASPTHVSSPTLAAPSPVVAPSPRDSLAESVYETGEEDFEDASDGEGVKSDITAAPLAFKPAPILTPTSHGTALAAFKDTISAPLSDATGSVSTTQPARRKSVRINPDPPKMSATPSGTPAMELDEEPRWAPPEQVAGGGWRTRIGRGWEDSSEESGEDEYEKVRQALA
ncbi:hypothetical protein FRC08_001569, partial [Ceratobasidium sp. 394]